MPTKYNRGLRGSRRLSRGKGSKCLIAVSLKTLLARIKPLEIIIGILPILSAITNTSKALIITILFSNCKNRMLF